MTDNIQPSPEKPNNNPTNPPSDEVSVPSNILELIRQASLQLGTILSLSDLSSNLMRFLNDVMSADYIMLFVRDSDQINFTYQLSYPVHTSPHTESKLKRVFINSFNAEGDPIVGQWLQSNAMVINKDTVDGSQAQGILDVIDADQLYSFPLVINQQLYGVLIVKLSVPESSQSVLATMKYLSPHLASYFANAYTYELKVKELQEGMHEVKILSQIDEELNATIQLPRVFRMIMDWALRFTNAHAAALATYDEESDNLLVMEHYGYELDNPVLVQLTSDHRFGITYRVARSGLPEVVPDVSMDSDYRSIKHNTRSQMSVPIMREERVEAVVTLESKNLNGFTDEHLDFVVRLSQRAGVAVDNARLFAETEKERQKLARILSNIKDIVILVGYDNQILLINQSALAGLSLYGTAEEYINSRFNDVIIHTELREFFASGISKEQDTMIEMQLPNDRHYHCQLSSLERIGWVLVMQDITHFKETDKLKSELLATASHDLKQPLSVMRGYIDLLDMTNTFDERSQRFLLSLNKAVASMQILIDELLDLARIESGIELQIEDIDLESLLRECLEGSMPKAEEKAMQVLTDIPEDFPIIKGDRLRLGQIFNNLIGNAIKYTPPEGSVRIYVERQKKVIRVSIQDTGLGISPEDKAQIFDRFYRVRRPETDSIEGTGLGLAIVKSLVEAHQGEITLVSQLNKGSTFHVTLPLGV